MLTIFSKMSSIFQNIPPSVGQPPWDDALVASLGTAEELLLGNPQDFTKNNVRVNIYYKLLPY